MRAERREALRLSYVRPNGRVHPLCEASGAKSDATRGWAARLLGCPLLNLDTHTFQKVAAQFGLVLDRRLIRAM